MHDQRRDAVARHGHALYTIDPSDGSATWIVDLDHNFNGVGIERHPGNGIIYACDTDGFLYSVDPDTGETVAIGEITGDSCNNLAAPWQVVDCILDP